ncbi:MAG: molybdopterin-dependent oxidoreductase, partial [Desulfatiglandales bacterium]|nr:molybdopterin-dependent oxidoreductase [Desulfatiglandales bacterium]
MAFEKMRFSIILFGLEILIRLTAMMQASFKKRLKEKNFTAQIKIQDNSQGRSFTFRNGKVTSKRGIRSNPDVCMAFRSVNLAVKLLIPPDLRTIFRILDLGSKLFMPTRDPLSTINAMKNFQLGMEGPDELTMWFWETLNQMLSAGVEYGTAVGNGVKRYTHNTNGGPVFVYVKEGKIIRITPIDFDDRDAAPWSIKARGKTFSPPRRTTTSPYTLAWKSMVYSSDRLLYPMKRVDFDPNGERNCRNRGVSGYEQIGWDEATDIVANEIKRVKRDYGPGAIMNGSGSHHTWGVLGYWLSSRPRFFNSIGFTPIVHNPDSWEGWYWGAMHHWGYSMRLGAAETYGTVEDCLKECEMVVFWSSDPEATSGVYGASEGTVRRQWLKELGIKMVHIDPYYNHTAAMFGGKWFAPRPATGNALALAIAYVWITENLYDKDYIANRTTGFDEWKDYILGNEDGTPKTPEWQENEAGIPARDVRALAREWGSKKTYLAAGGLSGFGSACRCATGNEWARSMVCLMAMQGLGKPGVNMGCMQQGTPVDTSFFFPGYAEGGLSGDIEGTALAVNMYQRMPQLPTVNTVYQRVPRLKIPEAILEGHTYGYPTDPKTIEGQFRKIQYP